MRAFSYQRESMSLGSGGRVYSVGSIFSEVLITERKLSIDYSVRHPLSQFVASCRTPYSWSHSGDRDRDRDKNTPWCPERHHTHTEVRRDPALEKRETIGL